MSFSAPFSGSAARAVLHAGEVPSPVKAFVQAVNGGDQAGLVDLFAAEALVNDQLRDFWGLDAISAWIASEVIAERLRLSVVAIVRHFGDFVLEAIVEGDFDKTGLPDPLILHFHCCLSGGKICRLIILSNRPSDTGPEIRATRPPP